MSKGVFAWIAAVSFVALIVAAVGGTIDPKQSDDKHVEYGKKFSCVARLICRNVSTNQTHAASCVVIAPQWVITAAHVVDGTDGWMVLLDDGTKKPLKSISIHHGFNGGVGNSDIAIGRVDGLLDLEFYPALYEDKDEAGKVVSIAGYGLHGTFETGATESDGKKRAGQNTIDAVSDDSLICSVSGGTPTELEFLIGSGDSGGGLFIGSKLAGVNSFIMVAGRRPRSKYGEESSHSRVSCYKSWIEQEMAADED